MRRRWAKASVFSCVLVGALLLAGCGGDEKNNLCSTCQCTCSHCTATTTVSPPVASCDGTCQVACTGNPSCGSYVSSSCTSQAAGGESTTLCGPSQLSSGTY